MSLMIGVSEEARSLYHTLQKMKDVHVFGGRDIDPNNESIRVITDDREFEIEDISWIPGNMTAHYKITQTDRSTEQVWSKQTDSLEEALGIVRERTLQDVVRPVQIQAVDHEAGVVFLEEDGFNSKLNALDVSPPEKVHSVSPGDEVYVFDQSVPGGLPMGPDGTQRVAHTSNGEVLGTAQVAAMDSVEESPKHDESTEDVRVQAQSNPHDQPEPTGGSPSP